MVLSDTAYRNRFPPVTFTPCTIVDVLPYSLSSLVWVARIGLVNLSNMEFEVEQSTCFKSTVLFYYI